ncbi:hypothetical protein NM208_g11092 [Fusarium decemcellulare]|uniref:Uncharacterized protein n=1 Tax=Fusarium decemcellulare TaxID=57161 RepID=A0ACC1RVI9_9HYPO|nr:hypothetical protein NM208_g11092 [Fusarium decemcellulare]
MFYLQSWQMLLIQHVEMTFSQNRLGGHAIQEWVKVIARARLIAKGIIKGLSQDLKDKPNGGVLAQIPQRGITNLVVKVNRRDWWTWTEAPDSQAHDNNAASEPPRLRLERHGLVGWTHQQDLFASDFAFTLVMETFGAKREQLERVVDEAKQLTWCTGSSRQLVWDGVVRDLSWDRVSNEVCAWLKKEPWKKTARRIEVRAVSFTLSFLLHKAVDKGAIPSLVQFIRPCRMSSSADADASSGDLDASSTQAITLSLSNLGVGDDTNIPEHEKGPHKMIKSYLLEHVEEFRHLQEMRKKGWESTQGDIHFNRQRKQADKSTETTERFFYGMMQSIGRDLNKATGAFDLSGIRNPVALDMCAAPGGFLAQILKKYPNARARAMSLPISKGGYKMRLQNSKLHVEFWDITTLAADMGLEKGQVPDSFPDADSLKFNKVFSNTKKHDLVVCDGAVLRTHERPMWRETHEATRLTLVQFALGLEHLQVGGTMVILLHKLDSWRSFNLIHQFSKFSTVQLFKHPKNHKIRSSFYLVAKDIQADNKLVKEAIATWKELYRVTTFGMEEEYYKMMWVDSKDVGAALDDFGESYVAMGRSIWKTQATALENASFMKPKTDGEKDQEDEEEN